MLQNTERCAGLLENKKEIERFVSFLHFMNDNVFIAVFFFFFSEQVWKKGLHF